jgi:outer membrane lipoprotein-sorting protein
MKGGPMTSDRMGWAPALAVAAALFAPAALRAAETPADVAAARDKVPPGIPDQAPARLWIKEIAARQAKLQSLVAKYEMHVKDRDKKDPVIESGVAKFRFAEGRPPQERWEGKQGPSKVLRIVRDGRVYAWVDDRTAQPFDTKDPVKLNPSLFRFPLLPDAMDVPYWIFNSGLSDYDRSDPKMKTCPYPNGICIDQKKIGLVSPLLKRAYFNVDPENGMVYRIRWYELVGNSTTVDLYEEKINAPVQDADFALPASAGGAAPEKKAGEPARK